MIKGGREDIVWKPIAGIQYEVNQLGEVRHARTKRIRKPVIRNRDYEVLDYWKDDKHLSIRVHRAVALAFIPRVAGKNFVNHIDSDRTNNHYKNLEWCTTSENVKHGYDYGKAIPISGMRNGMRKLNSNQVINIRHCKGEISQAKLARLYGVGHHCIGDIWQNITWRTI